MLSIPHGTNGESRSPAFTGGTFLGVVAVTIAIPMGAGQVLTYSKPSVIEKDLLITCCTTSAC